MDNPILYVILNKELKMSAGKAAAQTAHAVALLQNKHLQAFTDFTKRTVIVLEAENQQQMENLWEYLDKANVFADYYIDEGVNEVSAYSTTAMVVEPIAADDREKRDIFKPFNLFTAEESHSVLRVLGQAAILIGFFVAIAVYMALTA